MNILTRLHFINFFKWILYITFLIWYTFPETDTYCDDNPLPVRAPAAILGTTAEMNNPNFWINRIDNPDRLIMTTSQIKEFNIKNTKRTIDTGHPYAKNIERIEKDGPVFNIMKPLEIESDLPGSIVLERLKQNLARLKRTKFLDRWDLPFTKGKKDEIIKNMNLDTVPDMIQPKIAMVIRRTSARLFPTDEPGYLMRGYLDDINVTSLLTGMPVAVLHTSKICDYLFVMSPIAWGWVSAEDIAYSSERKIRTFNNPKDFIVITGHKVPLYSRDDFNIYLKSLYMGECLPMERKTNAGYRIIVPERDSKGSLVLNTGWISSDDTVSEGWLPYTQRNVIDTAFRLLGRPYGWHDSWNERDCGGIMMVIFRCFGITFPRYWSFEQLHSDHATYAGDIKDDYEKISKLNSMPQGITFVGTTGHIGLYLGTVEGKPYSIHECGWNYKDGDTEYKMARVVVSDHENVGFNMNKLQFFTPIIP